MTSQHNVDHMESIKTSLSNVMLGIEERMAKFEAELQKNTKTTSTPNLASLAAEFTSFRTCVLETLSAFRHQIEFLTHEVDNIEMRSRRKMLLIHGIAEQKNEETAQVVADVVKSHLKLDEFTADDIRRCQRMGRQTGAHKPRPILVKFEKLAMRDKIWFTKTKLKGTGKTVSEFLTKARHETFMAAQERVGVSKCWTREGHIFLLDPDGLQHRISTLGELNKLSLDAQKKPVGEKTAVTKSKRAAASKK